MGGLAQERLEVREGIFDRVEVRRVGREVEQARAGGLDELAGVRAPVTRQVVHHHDIARPQLGHESSLSWSPNQRSRCFMTSGRACSDACAVFYGTAPLL